MVVSKRFFHKSASYLVFSASLSVKTYRFLWIAKAKIAFCSDMAARFCYFSPHNIMFHTIQRLSRELYAIFMPQFPLISLTLSPQSYRKAHIYKRSVMLDLCYQCHASNVNTFLMAAGGRKPHYGKDSCFTHLVIEDGFHAAHLNAATCHFAS